ncbi:MAG TPA: hypothetical protein ENI29_14805 [bacterium]|nr:hypothetical protein [bacterium]
MEQIFDNGFNARDREGIDPYTNNVYISLFNILTIAFSPFGVRILPVSFDCNSFESKIETISEKSPTLWLN